MLRDLSVLLFLGINAWTDSRKKEISLRSLILFGILAGVLYRSGQMEWRGLQGAAMIPGVVLFLLAVITGGRIGMGDGLVVFLMGVYLTLDEILWIVSISMAAAAVSGCLLRTGFFSGRQEGRIELPFVPFLLCGYVGGLWLWTI